MIKVTFRGETVRAYQFVAPFTFHGVLYRSGSWIVLGNGWRDAYLPEQFVTIFGQIRGAA